MQTPSTLYPIAGRRGSIRAIENQKGKPKMKPPAQNISIDVPPGQIVRLRFAPLTEAGNPADLDGPLSAVVLDDPSLGETAVGGSKGLIVDIKFSEEVGSILNVEVDGDPDPAPGRQDEEVLSTIVTVRRVALPPPQAVTLGAKAENVTLVDAGQFGQFPTE